MVTNRSINASGKSTAYILRNLKTTVQNPAPVEDIIKVEQTYIIQEKRFGLVMESIDVLFQSSQSLDYGFPRYSDRHAHGA